MKKLSLFATTLLIANYSFADPSLAEKNLASAIADSNPDVVELSEANQAALSNFSEYEAVYISKSQKVVPEKKHEEDQALHYTIDITYPQIQGKNLTQAEKDFNQRIVTLVDNESKQFKNSVKLDIPHMKTLPDEALNNNLKIDYDLDVIHQLSLISVRIAVEGMQAGRAHPYRSHRVLNFDLAHNKEMALSDLFKPKSAYLQAIAEYSAKKLHETVHEDDKWMIQNGAQAVAKNYRNWNIEKEAILITFDEYQVAPYVYGPQEVEIPFTELQHLLSPQGKMISSVKEPVNNIG